MILIPAHIPNRQKKQNIGKLILLASAFISLPVGVKQLLEPSTSNPISIVNNNEVDTTKQPDSKEVWSINLDEKELADKVTSNGIRLRKDGYWYPTRKGEAGFIYIEIPANFEEMHLEFQVIEETDNDSGLDPSLIWRLTKLNPTLDKKKQQEYVGILAPEYAIHTRTDGSQTKTLENVGIVINEDLETSISAKRQRSQELPHPVILNQNNNLVVTRTSTSGNEGIYNIHLDFSEKNENGKITPMPKEFPITIPMPFNPLKSTQGTINLNLGTFFGHGLKITSLKIK
ncbi:MAG: hypothetical protein WAV40_04700 [Microgenomates group bacterium]